MSVFHRNWNEDPRDFLTSYLQHTAASSNIFKAKQFINYLGTGSKANDWFDELSHKEKKDWVAIENSFCKRWLKEEVLSIKETVTTKNELENYPILSKTTTTTLCTLSNTTYVVTDPNAAQTNHTLLATMSQAQTLVENGISTHLVPTVVVSVQTGPYVASTPSLATHNTQTKHPVHPELEITSPIFTNKSLTPKFEMTTGFINRFKT